MKEQNTSFNFTNMGAKWKKIMKLQYIIKLQNLVIFYFKNKLAKTLPEQRIKEPREQEKEPTENIHEL